ncbi:MAG: hypothetical protein LBJ57_08880 [Prevotellaceae bacterium]|jgi:hypothetical protein|nr:hypothetical protein [Prevotellaceae bacterium]
MKLPAFVPLATLLSLNAAAQVNYSPEYFGPNANPVPEFGNATIPGSIALEGSANYFFGFGDRTENLKLTAEVPLMPSFVSLKVWGFFLEKYDVARAVNRFRGMRPEDLSGWIGVGDVYVQVRVLLAKERRFVPAVILNSTLKTATPNENGFQARRYFDTPGYFFDLEVGKSFMVANSFLSEIRMVGNVGFLCWETTGSRQNDATMYGGKVILSNRLFDFENTLSGYSGWMNNGDSPLVYAALLRFRQKNATCFMVYKYGLYDYPYHLLGLGILISIKKLTPRYKK